MQRKNENSENLQKKILEEKKSLHRGTSVDSLLSTSGGK